MPLNFAGHFFWSALANFFNSLRYPALSNPSLRARRVPHYVHDPPAATIIEQLDTVNAVLERCSVRAAERVIQAQHVCEVANCFSLAPRSTLPEILHRKDRFHALNE